MAPKEIVRKNWRLLSALMLTLALIAILIVRSDSPNSANSCGTHYRDDKTVIVNSHNLQAEAATSADTRAQGLSGKGCIGQNQAMLFVFQQPGYYSFWMKDMKFPIDIVWIGNDHKTVDVIRNVLPSTYPYSFANKGQKAQYVLEMAANRSKSLNINPGTAINF